MSTATAVFPVRPTPAPARHRQSTPATLVRSLSGRSPTAGRVVRFGILGPLEFVNDVGPVAWRGAKRRGVLALLLVNRDRALSVDRIVEELWVEPTEGAPRTVWTYLSKLRGILEGESNATLVRRAHGYALEVDTDALDAARFEQLVHDARQATGDTRRAQLLREALACWNGNALEEFLGAPWADEAARHLESRRLEAHELCIGADLARGLGAELVSELESLTSRNPLHEQLWGDLMIALYRAGRQADALAACRRIRRRLLDELGVEPGPRLDDLERRILEHDSTLLAAPARTARLRGDIELAAAKPPAPGPAPRAGVELRDPDRTIGRLAELGRLDAMIAAVRAGRPRIAVVRGDSGIGKTRLVCDLVDQCAPNATVHFVSCPLSGRSFSALAALLDRVSPSEARVLGDVKEPDGPGIADNAEWQTLRGRVFAALRDALAPRPGTDLTLLVVDDVHWADKATLEFLDDLGTEMTAVDDPQPLALVVTRRAFGTDPAVDAVTTRLEGLPSSVTVRLNPLHELDVHELVRAHGIERPARALVRLLHDRSRGNPLYVTEALRHLEHIDAFVLRGGAIDTNITASELGAPADLDALVAHRLAELAPDDVEVLSVAAMHGETIDGDTLTDVAGRDVQAALERARDRGLVEATTGGFRFAHQLVVEVLRDRLTPEQQRATHRAIADALRTRAERDGIDVTSELGYHVVEGGLEGLRGHAIRELWDAGRVASHVADWAEAARMFEAAIALGEAREIDERALAWMRYWSGRCLEHDYDIERALTRFREAAAWGRDHDDIALWGLASLAAGTRVSVGTSEAFEAALDVSDFTDVLPHVDDTHPKLRCRLLRKYAEVKMQLRRFDEGADLAREALGLARRVDDPTLIAESASTLAFAHLSSGEANVALRLLRDLDRGALDGRPQSEGFALARLAIAALMVADLDTAEAAVNEAGAVFDAVRHRTGSTLTETLAANLALLQGDLLEAEQRGRRAHELFRVSQYFVALPILFSVLAETRAISGDHAGASETVRAWQRTGQRGWELVDVMLVARREPAALAHHAAANSGLLEFLTRPSVLGPSMAAVAGEVAHATTNVTLAQRLVENLDAIPDPGVVLGPGFPYVVARTRALALETCGDHAGALVCAYRALDAAEDARIPLEVARAHVAIARLSRDDQPRDAARHADAARTIGDQRGFVDVVHAARDALSR